MARSVSRYKLSRTILFGTEVVERGKSACKSMLRNALETRWNPPFHFWTPLCGERGFSKYVHTRTRFLARGARYSFVRAGARASYAGCTASLKEIHGGLYSVYTPIEIDIPGKVGAQQNQPNNASAGMLFAEHGNNR